MRRLLTAAIGGVALVMLAIGAVPPALSGARVLIVGDSITGDYGALVSAALKHQSYDPTVRAYPGLGLLDRGPRLDIWPLLVHDVRSVGPTVVFAEFSGDYGLANPPQPDVALDSPAYFARWSAAVDQFTNMVVATGAKLVWVIAPPPLHGATVSDTGLAAIYRGEATRPGRHGVAVFDTGPTIARRDLGGDLYQRDGRHLNNAGSAVVAGALVGQLKSDPAWRLRLDAVLGNPAFWVGVILAIGSVLLLAARSRRRAQTSSWVVSEEQDLAGSSPPHRRTA